MACSPHSCLSLNGPYHALAQLLPKEIIHVSLLQAVKVMLKAGVCIWVAVGKLVNIFFSVKTKCKGHHIILPMVWATVVVNIFRWQPLPERYKERHLGISDNHSSFKWE